MYCSKELPRHCSIPLPGRGKINFEFPPTHPLEIPYCLWTSVPKNNVFGAVHDDKD